MSPDPHPIINQKPTPPPPLPFIIICMTNQELPELTDYIQFWKRYINHNIILSVSNSFDVNIKFTYALEHEGKLPFLDVLLRIMGEKIYATVYRKATNNDVYLNWNAFCTN